MNQWKAYVKQGIHEKVLEEWREKIDTHRTTELLRYKQGPKWEKYIDGSWGAKCLFKFRVGDWDMGYKRVHWKGEEALGCRLCGDGPESVEHLILSCDKVAQIRNPWILKHGAVDIGDIARTEPTRATSKLLGIMDIDTECAYHQGTKVFLCSIVEIIARSPFEIVPKYLFFSPEH